MLETLLIKDKISYCENTVEVNTPDVCPYCKRYIYPNVEATTNMLDVKIVDSFQSVFAVVYSCPACKNFIFKTYVLTGKFEGGAFETQEFLIEP